jgi:hypothetical protein
MQHLQGSGTPVLYIGRTVLKVKHKKKSKTHIHISALNNVANWYITFVRGTLLVGQLVEAPRYKSEGRGFDSRWCHWNFSLT